MKKILNSKIKIQIIESPRTDANVEKQVQCICIKCNEPFERLAYENYCPSCILEILRSSTK